MVNLQIGLDELRHELAEEGVDGRLDLGRRLRGLGVPRGERGRQRSERSAALCRVCGRPGGANRFDDLERVVDAIRQSGSRTDGKILVTPR